MAFSQKLVNGETLTRENFANPPKELGIVPFWFWNGEMDEKEMEWQMREYKDKGIPGLFIHGRFGEKIGYLSETWFERVKFAVEKAKEIGIDIWIYDEMNWPSGTAERKVLKQYPHLTQKYLELVALNVDGPLFTFLEATDSRYVNTGDSKPIAAFACTNKEYQTKIEKLIDLTPNLSFNKVIPWEAPDGRWRLLYFLEKEVPYYIDTLNPESTNRFIELTHEGYKKAVGKDFGSIVPGFFTDEPAMHYYQVGVDNFVVPWSGQMFKIFREKRGYDLKPYLPALYLDMGEKTAKIRYDFWRTLTEQYAETYYRRIRNWCEENSVLFTGHVLFEEWLRLQARCEGNIFKYLKEMHITGVDHLYPKIGTRKEPDQHVALKLASSAAHHFGSARLLCESMGGTYWDCTLERMKWIANWEYVLGVNLFNNHGYHYSIEGERKRDWPPSQFYHHTWWKYYNRFTDYMARLGHVLSGGTHVAKLLILYPINSIWTNYVPQKPGKLSKMMERNFNQLTDTLLRLHYDFDYVDEDVLSEAAVKNGKIIIRGEEFELLILPPLTHIKKSSWQKIKKFVNGGGRVIADTILPFEFLEAENDGAVPEISSMFGFNPRDLVEEYLGNGKAKKKNSGNKNVFVLDGSKFEKEGKEKELDRLISQCIVPDVTISHEDVFYLHRIKDGYDIYFITNTTQKEIGSVKITFEQAAKPELWNPETGEIKPLNVYSIKNNRLVINLPFESSGSYVVILRDKIKMPYVSGSSLEIEESDGKNISGYSLEKAAKAFVTVQTKNGSRTLSQPAQKELPPIKTGSRFKFELEDDNVLCIPKWKMFMAPDGEEFPGDFMNPSYDDSSWLDVTMGAWEMQIPQERENETYPVELLYRTSFKMEFISSRLVMLIDGFSGSSYKLYINGTEVKDKMIRSKLDAEIKELNIKPYVNEGLNTVAVKLTAERRTDGILDLLKIAGNFSLTPDHDFYKIDRLPETLGTGDWTKKGFPYYSGTAVYTKEITIPENYTEGKLFLAADCGEDVLEIIINDGISKVIPWRPYRVDITGMVKPGKNKLEIKVTNTLINVLEAVKHKSGLQKQPVILHYNKYSFSI
jgi:hypothetical protein